MTEICKLHIHRDSHSRLHLQGHSTGYIKTLDLLLLMMVPLKFPLRSIKMKEKTNHTVCVWQSVLNGHFLCRLVHHFGPD